MFAGVSTSFVFVILIFSEITGRCHAAEWSYMDQAAWPELCQTGQMQSPIDLNVAESMPKNFSKFIFEGYAQTATAIMTNNGHSDTERVVNAIEYEPTLLLAKIVLQGVTPPKMSGGGLMPVGKIYELDHLHFHWESEHTLNKRRFPLELHMVHYAKESGSLTEALKTAGNVAVLGVFFEISPEDDDDFIPLMNVLDVLVKESVNAFDMLSHFNAKSFMPKDRAGFFRYEGSLTTPDCTEGVVWTVFTNTLRISSSQVAQFEQLKTINDEPLTFNNREIQAKNGRAVYLKESPVGQFSMSGAISQEISIIGLIFTVTLVVLS